MTHKDIYTKFLIEYDKANVTSSYPSLTEYEVATLLDKAYLALIAQKVTGNNPRRSSFEADVKAVADIQPLVKHIDLVIFDDGHQPAANITQFRIPSDYMYSVQTMLNYRIQRDRSADESYVPEESVYNHIASDFENIDTDNPWVQWYETYDNNKDKSYLNYNDIYSNNEDAEDLKKSVIEKQNQGGPMNIKGEPYDKHYYRYVPCKLVPHEIAEKFFVTPYNIPWVKIPVYYIESNVAHIVYDPLNKPMVNSGFGVHFIYVSKPEKFVNKINDKISFELSDAMAEELINLAITFALENVESPRLNTKLNTRGLEA